MDSLFKKLLLLPEKPDTERDALARAFEARGGDVMRVGRFWDPPPVTSREVAVYGNDTFCLVLGQKLGLELISPRDEVLVELPEPWLGRSLSTRTLAAIHQEGFPCFCKPVVPKLFAAAVYESGDVLRRETEGMDPASPLYFSEVVSFECEVRAFVMNRAVLDRAVYEGHLLEEEALDRFLGEVVQSDLWPAVYVLDVGYITDKGWVVIEANASWGAGLNGCSPEKVLPSILAATCVAS